jgi:hypothetical protein
MLRTSENAKSMCGLFFDQRLDNGATNLQSYDIKEILNKRLDGKGPFWLLIQPNDWQAEKTASTFAILIGIGLKRVALC